MFEQLGQHNANMKHKTLKKYIHILFYDAL